VFIAGKDRHERHKPAQHRRHDYAQNIRHRRQNLASWIATRSASPGLHRFPHDDPSNNVAAATTGGNRAASNSGTKIGPTAAAAAVWLLIAMFVKNATAHPPGRSNHPARRSGFNNARTIARSQPVARNTSA